MKKSLNQKGFAHIQIIAIIAVVVLASALTFWRINNNSQSASVDENDELTSQEVAELAQRGEFIDEDHDLIPLCAEGATENCEDSKKDHDFDNDGIEDSLDKDDDNDGEESDESEDDSDNDDVADDSDDDDDNDGVDDDDDDDDDNDGVDDDSSDDVDDDSSDDDSSDD